MTKELKKKKQRDYERMEKCIYGMHLAKAQHKWVEDNNASNDKFASYLLTTPKTKNRAIAGTVTDDNMVVFAERLGLSVDDMKAVTFSSIMELLHYRFSESEHRRSMILGCMMIIFALITTLIGKIGPALMMIVSADLFLNNARNLWNIKLAVDGHSKSMIFIDIAAVLSTISLFVIICMY